MKFYMAPMEGLTGYVYRNVYHELFNSIDTYFTPFIAPAKKKLMRTRECKDVDLDNNQNMHVVPQILTNDAQLFLRLCQELYSMGYKEVNLNAGCPSMTVVSKGKGAGMLTQPKVLDAFLSQVFNGISQSAFSDMKVSVKTRLGMEFASEFYDLIDVYSQYPLSELIVHPRLQKDFYNGKPDWDTFEEGITKCSCPVCYNGDIFSKAQFESFTERFPNIDRVMLGRGLIANPALIEEILGREQLTKEKMKQYHDLLVERYHLELKNERDMLFKMKEFWFYAGDLWDEAKKPLKEIKKAQNKNQYQLAVSHLFSQCDVKAGVHGFRC